jgi:hypothetical protein
MENNLKPEMMKYIVFLIDSKIKEHDGKVFCNYNDAKDFTRECILQKYSEKAIIGMFVFDKSKKEMLISHIESIGFSGDKKDVNQLQLFKPSN